MPQPVLPATPRPQRTILLAVTGLSPQIMSPQIITETRFGLATQESPVFPDEVHGVTTAQGAERIRLELLSEDPGWFHGLALEEGRFNEMKSRIRQAFIRALAGGAEAYLPEQRSGRPVSRFALTLAPGDIDLVGFPAAESAFPVPAGTP